MKEETLNTLARLSLAHFHINSAINELERIKIDEKGEKLRSVRSDVWEEYYEIYNNLSDKEKLEVIKLGYHNFNNP